MALQLITKIIFCFRPDVAYDHTARVEVVPVDANPVPEDPVRAKQA